MYEVTGYADHPCPCPCDYGDRIILFLYRVYHVSAMPMSNGMALHTKCYEAKIIMLRACT